MCKVMQEYEEIAVSEARVNIIKNLLNNGMSEKDAVSLAEGAEDELEKAKTAISLQLTMR